MVQENLGGFFKPTLAPMLSSTKFNSFALSIEFRKVQWNSTTVEQHKSIIVSLYHVVIVLQWENILKQWRMSFYMFPSQLSRCVFLPRPSSSTVSYTHLDVYKRQPLNYSITCHNTARWSLLTPLPLLQNITINKYIYHLLYSPSLHIITNTTVSLKYLILSLCFTGISKFLFI